MSPDDIARVVPPGFLLCRERRCLVWRSMLLGVIPGLTGFLDATQTSLPSRSPCHAAGNLQVGQMAEGSIPPPNIMRWNSLDSRSEAVHGLLVG
jgi:hypothetical protein